MIHFRTATIQDSENIARLVNSAYRGIYSKQGWTTEADFLDGQRTDSDSLSELISTPHNQIELAFNLEGELVGSVHVRFEQADTLYFGMLSVEPTLQSRGLGKELLEHVEKVARGRDLSRIRMTVIPFRTSLIEFYERRGYRATGVIEPFPSLDPRFGVPKVEGLCLKEFIKLL
jgi:ribosomal protein S18 acetylase RimI-like enzyme